MRYILTAQADALPLAVAEAGHPQIVRQLAPGIVLCEQVGRLSHPVFLRHLHPAQQEIPIAGTMDDLPSLGEALQSLVDHLEPEKGAFSIQTRILEGYATDYKPYDINTALSDIVKPTGIPLDVRQPKQVISVTIAPGTAWVGVSTVEQNLSAWAGGARRFKWEAGQISRAEFKLLEAMEMFGIVPMDGTQALDLGAAPGGWTRILRRHGLYVTAVDPAALDDRLARDKRVVHCRQSAQSYLARSAGRFDIIVNDMKMDSAQSVDIMVDSARLLAQDGCALLTVKLPENVDEWLPRLEDARARLQAAYGTVAARQLFHNRHEITLFLQQMN